MSHKTLIGGTPYDVSGGKTLVNGTIYRIAGGRTLVRGTVYDISFKWTFKINEKVYHCDKEMLWGNWINSSYNTDGFTNSQQFVIGPTGSNVKDEETGAFQRVTMTIKNGGIYHY